MGDVPVEKRCCLILYSHQDWRFGRFRWEFFELERMMLNEKIWFGASSSSLKGFWCNEWEDVHFALIWFCTHG
jgi:hypothetical protein